MTPLDDLDFEPARASEPTAPPPEQEAHLRQSRLAIAGVAVVVACLAVGGWYWWSSATPAVTTPSGSSGTEATIAQPEPLGTGAALDLPPLDALDPVVRSLLRTLSARPELARLLATDNLLRRFVVSVENVGRGASPVRQLAGVSVDGKFSVERPYSESAISPSSFARYDALAATVADIEPSALASVYGQLKPRLDEAYGELGSGGTFDAAMERAIVHLLAVSPDLGHGDVVPVKGVSYAWTSPEAENLSPAQKQLLRMGPANARRVQAALRDLALALGIPRERLPR